MYDLVRLVSAEPVRFTPGRPKSTAPLGEAAVALCPMDEATLRARIAGAEAVAIMKVGRHLAKIRAVIDDLGLTDSASYVERATLPEQVVVPLSQAPEKAPYFSMILLTKGADPWL